MAATATTEARKQADVSTARAHAPLTHAQLIDALELRFDYLSARAVVHELLEHAGVGLAAEYDAHAVARLRDAAGQRISRPAALVAALSAAQSAGQSAGQRASLPPNEAQDTEAQDTEAPDTKAPDTEPAALPEVVAATADAPVVVLPANAAAASPPKKDKKA